MGIARVPARGGHGAVRVKIYVFKILKSDKSYKLVTNFNSCLFEKR